MSGQDLTRRSDDMVAPFTVEGAPLRGRIARLGAGTVDAILRRHEYPAAAALLLGEALVFASLMGALLKIEGRLIVQAQGEGAVRLLVAEHSHDGGLRGYARLGPDAAARLASARRLAPADVLGEGVLAVTLDRGQDFTLHQGFVPLTGATLAACAEAYFRDSEQTETRIKLSVGEVIEGARAPYWRAGGALIQKIAPDDARGETEEGWRRSAIFFDTLTDEEMLDPGLPADRVLYRLFQEDGVRMGEPAPLADRCACDEGRVVAALQNVTAEEMPSLIEPDGFVHARCQFCGRLYRIAPAQVLAANGA